MKNLIKYLSILSVIFGFSVTSYAGDSDFKWTGFYAGVHAGSGSQKNSFSDASAQAVVFNCCFLIGTTSNGSPSGSTSSSTLIGVQLGGMYQIEKLVFGFDVDWSSTNFENNNSQVWSGAANGIESVQVKTNWTATQTLSLGFAQQRWLVFGRTGIAEANNSYSVEMTGTCNAYGSSCPGGSIGNGSGSNLVIGGIFGVGAKYAFTDKIFANLQYDYMNFGTSSKNISGNFGGIAGSISPTIQQQTQAIKLGINYLF